MKFFSSIWNSFTKSVRGFDSPRQLALGVVLGMMIGLIPKDSMLPYLIGLIALLTPANLVCIALSAIVFSFLSPSLDSVSHQIGGWMLTFDPFESFWAYAFQLPVVPWTRFENTVVMGTTCLGFILALPTYLISLSCFKKFGSAIYRFFVNTRVARWLVDDEPANQLQKS